VTRAPVLLFCQTFAVGRSSWLLIVSKDALDEASLHLLSAAKAAPKLQFPAVLAHYLGVGYLVSEHTWSSESIGIASMNRRVSPKFYLTKCQQSVTVPRFGQSGRFGVSRGNGLGHWRGVSMGHLCPKSGCV
jgi:hypothetical protein